MRARTARNATATALATAALIALLALPGIATALPCNPDTAECLVDSDCDDGDVCNGRERCLINCKCARGRPLDCDDHNDCTSDSCDMTSGCLHAMVPNDTSCSDGNVCNGMETCQNGGCTPGTPLDCDDGNACTADSCDPVAGCHRTPLDCDDRDPCTIDGCDPGRGCFHARNETCTPQGETQCDPASPLGCDDGDPCTEDTCGPATGTSGATCHHTPAAGFDAVGCVCKRGTTGMCGGQPVPAAIGRRFDQACGLIGRAGTTKSRKKGKAFVRRAKRVLSAGERAIARLKKEGRLGEPCAAQLDALFGDALGRAERWLTTP